MGVEGRDDDGGFEELDESVMSCEALIKFERPLMGDQFFRSSGCLLDKLWRFARFFTDLD